jgi:23S rRNA pseudouridine1911/1915/1917 synthase
MEPKIVLDDDGVVVIDKPAGMVVNNSQTNKELTVQEWFVNRTPTLKFPPPESGGGSGREYWDKGGVVHRLDKETSGLLILAKTPEAYENLKQQFLERKTVKKYVALVHGILNPEAGIISEPIERNPKAWGKFTIGTDLSRMAITEWSVREKYKDYSVVDLMPMTGRTHQLRVHLKHLGHSIVGDPLYAGDKVLKIDQTLCPRMFLHAYALQFTHPTTGKLVALEIELPSELKQTLEKLVH